MPLPQGVAEELRRIVGRESVVDAPNDLRIFERDGSIEGAIPDAVVLASTTREVSDVIKVAAKHRIPVVPRGAGTGLSGGAVTIRGGIALQVTRMRRILEIDPVGQTALVEPGVVNQELSLAAAQHGLFYAPDPSSQKACTIGGNAAENSGGPHCHAGYPTDAGAVLLVEVDGIAESTRELTAAISKILGENQGYGLREAQTPAERELLWAGRKGAIGALGRIKPNYYLHDGVVPRSRLPQVLSAVGEIGEHYQLPVANVFHAGDGNLHPNILFDLRDRQVLHQVEAAGEEMLRAVVELGGALSGEHGIGLEKRAFMPWIYSE